MKLEKPDINPSFFYGPIISYQFNGDISKDRGKYRIRFTLFFKSGNEYSTQKSGFNTLAEARRAKEALISQLEKREYVPFDYTVKEFFDYWLYYYMIEQKEIRYNTFQTYQNALYNYLLPSWGGNRKLKTVTAADIVKSVKRISYPSVKKLCINLVNQMFDYANRSRYLPFNPGRIAARNLKKEMPEKVKRNIEPYTTIEIRALLFTCRQSFSDMYIPLLISITTGLRISETIGLKYPDIDFTSRSIYIRRQLGRDINDADSEGLVTKELDLKTHNGIRNVPLADWVADEIIVRRAWYEKQRNSVPDFHDTNYICCQYNGNPFNRSSFIDDFHALIGMCGLRPIHWHDLRHMYASVLKNNEVNMKAISAYLGHGSQDFTDDVYIYKAVPVYDCSILAEVWDSIRPNARSDSQREAVVPLTNDDFMAFFD